MTAIRPVPNKSQSPSETRLVAVLDAYLAAVHEGRAPTREELLAQHPDLASDLETCLASLEFIRQASLSASPLVGPVPAIDGDEERSGLGDLGDFRIVREVGRGGMGVVYEAVQRSLNRRVALKVLPFAAAMDPTQIRRFQTEAQAAAQLHHTNIVPVFWIGNENGVHYYAMQFIEGRTLADVIQELRQLEGKDRRGDVSREGEAPAEPAASDLASALSRDFPPWAAREDVLPPAAAPGPPVPSAGLTPTPPSGSSTRNRAYFRNVARLGMEAAEALEHAHQEGIIHRDIKPANLMVDARGHLWITDFGLARLQNDSGLTITGDLLGTLRYMSPEQALGKRGYMDHRTDIYSLGVTLHELLTLEPAFGSRDRAELLRRIADDEPRSPRRLDDSIPRELETIVLKATAKEPTGRYQTAQDLGDDLRRFLEHKPIRARRPTLWERAMKLGRRHAGIVAAALLVLLLAVGGLTTSIVLIGRERDATRAALARAIDQEKIARSHAEEAMAQARRAFENHNWFIQGLTEPLKRMANPDLSKDPEYASMRREVISEAIRGYRGFLETQDEGPVSRFEAADTWLHIALLRTVADDHESAQDAYRMAIRICEDWNDKRPSTGTWSAVGQVRSHLAMELWEEGKRAESEPHFRRAVDAFRRALEREPQHPGILQSSAWFLSLFQDERFRDPPRALEHARRLVALSSEKDNRRFFSFGRRPLFTLGLAEYRMGNLDAARKALERSIELREGGDAYEGFVLAMVVARQGDRERARQLHREAVRWMRRYRYSDFELHALDTEAASVLEATVSPTSTARKEENTPRPSKP